MQTYEHPLYTKYMDRIHGIYSGSIYVDYWACLMEMIVNNRTEHSETYCELAYSYFEFVIVNFPLKICL